MNPLRNCEARLHPASAVLCEYIGRRRK